MSGSENRLRWFVDKDKLYQTLTSSMNYIKDINKNKCHLCNVDMIHLFDSWWECPICQYKRNRWWDNPRNGKPIEICKGVFLCGHQNDLDVLDGKIN